MSTNHYYTGVGNAIKNYYQTGDGPMNVVYEHSTDTNNSQYYNLLGIMLHLSDAGENVENGISGDFVIQLESHTDINGVYDVVLFRQSMEEVSDIVWKLEIPIKFYESDKISFSWENASGLTWGLIYSIS